MSFADFERRALDGVRVDGASEFVRRFYDDVLHTDSTSEYEHAIRLAKDALRWRLAAGRRPPPHSVPRNRLDPELETRPHFG